MVTLCSAGGVSSERVLLQKQVQCRMYVTLSLKHTKTLAVFVDKNQRFRFSLEQLSHEFSPFVRKQLGSWSRYEGLVPY